MTIRQCAALLFASIFCCAFGQCDNAGSFLQAYGYSELRPPSQFLGPGTLISVIRTAPFEARVVCSAESSLGPHMRVMRSRTASSSLKQLDNQRFVIDIASLVGGKGNEHFQAVRSVTATLKNARIIELSDDDVLLGMRDRTLACERAVQERVRQGYVVTMVSSVLMGDLSIDVSFEHKRGHHADLADKSMVMMDLAVMLDAEMESSASSSLQSKDLVFGLRDDEFLSALSISGVNEADFERDTRHMPKVLEPSRGTIVAKPAP